jgi:ferric-dicitrate binding protein FerR (iron transport regulator)
MIVERGSISIATQRGLPVQVGCMMITPAAGQWTEFQVKDNLGLVDIAVTKGSVTVAEAGKTDQLGAGQRARREDCARQAKERRRGAVPGATGGILDSTWVQVAGIGAVGGTLIWVLTREEEPISPKVP